MDRGGLGVVYTWLRANTTAAMVVIDPATVADLTKRRGIAAELKALAWETSATIITVQTL